MRPKNIVNKAASVAIFLLVMLFFSAILGASDVNAQTLSPAEKARLEAELAQVEADQKAAEKELASAQAKSASLSNDIAVLNAKIKTAQLNIRQKNLIIQTLGNDIVNKQKHIDNLESHITKGKESIAGILRKTNEVGNYTLPEILLSQKSVTGFFQDVESFDSVHASLQTTFDQLREDQAETTQEKNILDARKNAEVDARQAIQQEERNIAAAEKEKKALLAISKSNEKSYNAVVAEKRAKAAQIRAQLFALRDAAPIPFGQALQHATLASQKTGVRPALILAILTQESNLGSNVGQCYVTNTQTGDGIYAKTGNAARKVMSPTRDVPVFIDILKQIGGEYSKQVVSCPILYDGEPFGWGGAMGPSQFIPSTWVLVADSIAAAVGISGMPDPWNPAHAIMATAILMRDNGARSGSYTAERNAACKYYSGQSCGNVRGNTSYGESVMALAAKIQREMIDPLQGL